MHKSFGLCAGRHTLPVSEFIFGESLCPMDFSAMQETARLAFKGIDDVTVYVTGLTSAMLAVAAVCHAENISLTAMHYDRDSGKYVPQVVIPRRMRCVYCGQMFDDPDTYYIQCPHCGAM